MTLTHTPLTPTYTYTPVHTADSIYYLYTSRKMSYGADFERMREVQAIMDGEIVVPLPELSKNEQSSVANLALRGMTQLAQRTASINPTLAFPSTRPGIAIRDTYARNRLRVMTGWHHATRMRRVLGKRARFLLAYGCSPILVKPNINTGLPCWYPQDPLHTFPSERADDDFIPYDCILETTHTYRWLLDNYPEQVRLVSKPSGWDYDDETANYDARFTILEYIDAHEDILILCGSEPDADPYSLNAPLQPPTHAILNATPNLTSRPLVITAGAINLSKPRGHFDGMIGMYLTQAAMMAMTITAQRRAIWPREWLVARPNESPQVITVPDPASGRPGELQGGDLTTQTIDPSYRALEVMDRLEYAQRQEAGLPAEFGGMSSTNIRTGRRGAQVLGNSIDFTISEAQDIFADSITEENKTAIAIDRTYFNYRKLFSFATRSYNGTVDYTPSDTWETDEHIVDYPLAGTDLQNLPIEGGQRVAMNTLSREGFMEIDPLIRDPQSELQRITREGIGVAFLSSIQQLAAMPEGPYQPIHLARLDEKLARGMQLYEAVKELQSEIQEEQAAAAPTPPQEQPGLSPPGQGVEQQPSIPETDTSMGNMASLLSTLGTTQQAQKYRG